MVDNVLLRLIEKLKIRKALRVKNVVKDNEGEITPLTTTATDIVKDNITEDIAAENRSSTIGTK